MSEATNTMLGMRGFEGLTRAQIEQAVREDVKRANKNPTEAYAILANLERLEREATEQINAKYPELILSDGTMRVPSQDILNNEPAAAYLHMIQGKGIRNLSQKKQLTNVSNRHFNKTIRKMGTPSAYELTTGQGTAQTGNTSKDIVVNVQQAANNMDLACLNKQDANKYNAFMNRAATYLSAALSKATTDKERRYLRYSLSKALLNCSYIWVIPEVLQLKPIIANDIEDYESNLSQSAYMYAQSVSVPKGIQKVADNVSK